MTEDTTFLFVWIFCLVGFGVGFFVVVSWLFAFFCSSSSSTMLPCGFPYYLSVSFGAGGK